MAVITGLRIVGVIIASIVFSDISTIIISTVSRVAAVVIAVIDGLEANIEIHVVGKIADDIIAIENFQFHFLAVYVDAVQLVTVRRRYLKDVYHVIADQVIVTGCSTPGGIRP